MNLVDAHSHFERTQDHPWHLRNFLWENRDQVHQSAAPCSLGVHPWFPPDLNTSWPTEMEAFLSLPQIRAVGEAGIDRAKSPLTLEEQIQIFGIQAQLAEKKNLPLVVHAVRSIADILALHKQWQPRQPWIVHGFQDSPESGNALLKRGICLSFGCALLDDRKSKLQSFFRTIPSDQLLLESDDHPELLARITQRAAQLRTVTPLQLSLTLQKNWCTLFGDPDLPLGNAFS